ncbi:MAG: hypothetical protein ABEH38_07740 [Flavobacteriales bacterium]
MELKGKRILLVSPQTWEANKVSKHHYALELAERGAQVFFLDPPGKRKGREVFRSKEELAPGIRRVIHEAPLQGLRFLPGFIRRPLMRGQIRRLEKACGIEGFDIVWSFEGSRFFELSLFGEDRLKLFHMVDLVQDQNLSKVAGTADLALCTTVFIEAKLAPYTGRLVRIPHGYRPGGTGVEEGVRKEEGVQVGYLGNLSIPFLDRELILELVDRFPPHCFHFFGPGDRENDPFLRELGTRDNVFLHGPLPAERVLGHLAAMDLLLILYDADRYSMQVASPHKMMDYLASGKPIVATWMEEYSDRTELIRMVERRDDFIPAFEEVIENLEEWNTPELQERRKAIAEAQSYDKLLDRILEKAREAKPEFFR